MTTRNDDDAELKALLHDDPDLLSMVLERLEYKGLICDTGARRNAKIVYAAKTLQTTTRPSRS